MNGRNTAYAAAVFTSFLVLSSVGNSSRLPPSDPDSALDLGILDGIVTVGADQRFNCRAATDRLTFTDPHYNTRYYKFRIDSDEADLTTKMRETPDASLWFHLLDSNLNFLREIKGGDDQLVVARLKKGDYYLQLITDGSKPDQNGQNLAEITFKATPVMYGAPDPSGVKDLGVLNGKISEAGALVVTANREFPYFVPLNRTGYCPVIPGVEKDDYVDEFSFTAQKGNVYIGLTVTRALNWPFDSSGPGLYLWVNGTWQRISGSFYHQGGKARVAVGYPPAPQVIGVDAYAEYVLKISK